MNNFRLIALFMTIILLLYAGTFGQNKLNDALKGTWKFKVTEECYDSLIFMKSKKITEYSCETQETLLGNWKIQSDSLVVTQNGRPTGPNGKYTDSDFYGSVLIYKFVSGKWKLVFAKYGSQAPKTNFDTEVLFEKVLQFEKKKSIQHNKAVKP